MMEIDFPPVMEIPHRRRPVDGVVRPPGSKSITNRALVIAALARGVSRLEGPLQARDTEVMRAGLRQLGVLIDDVDDPWLVLGTAGGAVGPRRGAGRGRFGHHRPFHHRGGVTGARAGEDRRNRADAGASHR